MSTGRVLSAVLAVAALGAAGSPAASAASCPERAQCTTITVPLDHSGRVAGTLPLAYARVPASGTRTGTLVVLSGGPGQAAIPITTPGLKLLAPLRAHYDLVFVDQRGTGQSGAVDCSDVAGCITALGDRRAFLTTAETALDLENLRTALGVAQLTLFGVSYGTKVAQEYVRRFPAQTAAVVLDSPTPVDGLDGVSELPSLGAPRVLRETCFPGACSRTVRDPAAALAAAAARLQHGAVSGPLVSSAGNARAVKVHEADLYQLLSASDVSPALRAGLPAAIASLATGDAAPLLHLTALTAGTAATGDESVNTARFLATLCVEGRLPWTPESPVAGRAGALRAFVAGHAAAFAPFRASTVLDASPAALCAKWPPTPAPSPVPYAGPNVPVLILSGREDLRTPTEDARRTLAQYPDAKLLAVPGVGHSVLGSDPTGCAVRGVAAFLGGGTVSPCSSRFTLTAPPYLPASVAALRPMRLAGLPGRTLRAVELTLEAVVQDATLKSIAAGRPGPGAVRVPGLRGGWARASAGALELHGVELFRGVRVSGRLGTRDDDGQVTVSGPEAAAGAITFTGDTYFGSLGGVPIRG